MNTYLEDVSYPASKDDLIKAAEAAGEPESTLDALRAAPSVMFGDQEAARLALAGESKER